MPDAARLRELHRADPDPPGVTVRTRTGKLKDVDTDAEGEATDSLRYLLIELGALHGFIIYSDKEWAKRSSGSKPGRPQEPIWDHSRCTTPCSPGTPRSKSHDEFDDEDDEDDSPNSKTARSPFA